MYNLPYHKEENSEILKEFIAQNPFALLTGCDSENRPIATQIPLMVEYKGENMLLRGHIMKNTDHHKAFIHNQNVLVVFTGKHSYVSGTWYSNPYSPSTWNYMSVHAKGSIQFLDDNSLKELLQHTSLHFEGYNQKSTTVFNNLPDAFKQKVMPALVAFEIKVSELDTVFKLSQDRDEGSYQNIIDKLMEQGCDSQEIATEMEKRTKELFPKN